MKYNLRYIISMLFVLLFTNQGMAQNDSIIKDSISHFEIGFEIDAMVGSSLNNALLYSSGYIDENLKDENLKRLSDVNIGGNYSDFKMFYRKNDIALFGQKNLDLYSALEWHYLDEYRFTKDVYSLLFYGNKQFAGAKADLSYTGRQQLKYYQIKVGLIKSTANQRHQFGLNLALNFGNSRYAFQYNNPSSLSTNSLGTELVLTNNVDYYESDTSLSKWYQVSGIGTSIDLFYKFEKEGCFSFQASVENLGFIHWNKNALHFSENKNHVFQGLEVDNVFDMPNPLIQSNDTLSDYIYSNSKQEGQLMMLPFDIKLREHLFFMNQKLQVSAFFHYRVLSYMMPLIQVDATYRLTKNFKMGPVISYGAYSAFNAGIKLQFDFYHYQIKLESRYLTGFAQHSFSGMGGFINFTYKL